MKKIITTLSIFTIVSCNTYKTSYSQIDIAIDNVEDYIEWLNEDLFQGNINQEQYNIMKESYDSLQTMFMQLGGYSLAHNTVYGSSITQGVILLAPTELIFQVFRINNEKLIEYQNKFLDRVDQYYSLINK